MTEHDRLVAGRYRLGERVGSGAMGIVWRARDERLRRTVAVKQLLVRPGLSAEKAEEARSRAMREARIAARLQHPFAVTVYDVVEHDDQPWLIMEYVPSRSLGAELAERGPLPPYRVARIGSQVAAALAAAHAAGVVHRDVKPGNVLLADDGTAKITDFGISRAVDDVVLTATGLLSGTPAYLAPELAKGAMPAASSDVFALGSTLYAAVEGTPPFGTGDNPLALLHTVAAGNVTPPANAGPLTDPLMSLLANNPDDRPTMREAHELLAHVAELGVHAEDRAEDRAADPGRAWTKPVAPVPAPVGGPALQHGPPSPPIGLPIGGQPGTRLDTRVPVPGTGARRHRSARLLLVAALAALVVGVGVLALTRSGHGRAGTPVAGAGHAPVTTSSVAPPAPGDGVPTLASMRAAVRTYYGLLPRHQAAAWLLLSTRYQQASTFENFQVFYDGIASVTVGPIRELDANEVSATLTFTTTRGTVTHEPYRFVMVDHDGHLLIDDATRSTPAT